MDLGEWIYSLDTLNKLGINDIVLIDGEWSPIIEFEDAKLFVIETFD